MGSRAGAGTGQALLGRVRGPLIVATVAAVAAAALVGAPAASAMPTGESWVAELSVADGDNINIASRDGAIRLRDPAPQPTSTGPMRAEGQLSLAPRRLSAVSDRIATALIADQPPGSQTVVSVRSIRSDGNWSTWRPLPPDSAAHLDEPTLDVQIQLHLIAPVGAGDGPVVHGLWITTSPAGPARTPCPCTPPVTTTPTTTTRPTTTPTTTTPTTTTPAQRVVFTGDYGLFVIERGGLTGTRSSASA